MSILDDGSHSMVHSKGTAKGSLGNSLRGSIKTKKKKRERANSTLGMMQEEIRFDNKLRDKASKKDKVLLQK